MPTIIKMRLCEKDIQAAIKQVNAYEKQLVSRCNIFVGKLAELGLSVANAKVSEAPLGKYVQLDVKYEPFGKGCRAMLVAKGQTKNTSYGSVNTLLMIEFGAGIYYNSVANPKSSDFGMGVGTFPGQTHAFEEGWYYMDDNDNQWHYTHGVKATMPMYSADETMLLNIRSLAKQIFSS